MNLQINFKYNIVKIEGDVFTLSTILTDDVQHVGDLIITNSFMFDYCSTCHSTQGASINGKACIFDYNNKLANWRWLWSAITRATQLENVYVYRYTNDKDYKFNENLVCL